MYENRTEAGQALARELRGIELERPVVLALPRGGVPVALPVAEALNAPLDLILVRKIGAPGQEELAAGAIVDGPPEQVFFNDHILKTLRLRELDFRATLAVKRKELAARREMYLAGRTPIDVGGRDVVVIDDGIATGATVRTALMSLAARRPRRVILAVPVAAADTLAELAPLVDRIICPLVPDFFRAVGMHYRDFRQVPDDEVSAIMARANSGGGTGGA